MMKTPNLSTWWRNIFANMDAATGRSRRAWLQFGAIGVVIFFSLTQSLQIWTDVSGKIHQLRTSHNDNVIWNLTQLEVEYLKFERSLKDALLAEQADSNRLDSLRRRFNIYYSRLETLNDGPLYQRAFEAYRTGGLLDELRTDVAIIEGYFHLEDADFYERLPRIAEMQDGRERMIRRIITRGNQYASVTGQAARDEISRLLLRLFYTAIVLITALGAALMLLSRQSRRHRAQALEHKTSSARFATVIATSPDALIVTDDHGSIVEFNHAAERLVGVKREDAIDKPFKRYLKDDKGSFALLPLAQGRRASAVQLTLQTASEALVPVELSQGVAEFQTQRFYVYFLRNISDRLAADRALLASRDRALSGERAKSRFLAVMSHEMRTPLNGILGLVELMRGDQTSEEERERYLGLLRNSGQILLDHVNDVLDIAQLEADGVTLNIGRFDLDQMLIDLVGGMELAAQARGNQIRLDKPELGLGWFSGDANRLRQVLINLISNAVKFTENGQITVSVACYRGSRQGDAKLEFQIADTGVGISEEDAARVFQDFVRLELPDAHQAEGTGLGLGNARRIVTAMGGDIGVDSLEGEGSTFWVTLELPRTAADPASLRNNGHDAAQLQEQKPLKILVVEDNATNRLVVRDLLERDGHQVEEEINGQLGVERAAREWFDVILMDLNMPVMGGLDACRAIRQSNGVCAQTRIVALTAHVMERNDKLYTEVGMDDVLSKPLEREDLRRALRGERAARPCSKVGKIAFDQAHLRQVLAPLSSERATLLLSGVRDEGNALIARLEMLLKEPPSALAHQSFASDVHSLAGAASMVGARKLRNALNALEDELGQGGLADLVEWHEYLVAIWQETLVELDVVSAEIS
jgi:PAS domain S-box-containing protein